MLIYRNVRIILLFFCFWTKKKNKKKNVLVKQTKCMKIAFTAILLLCNHTEKRHVEDVL